MVKEDKRKNIKVNESVFEDFSDRCHAYNFTQSEMLQTLLQKEITVSKTEVINSKMSNRIEKGEDMDSLIRKHNFSKAGDI